MRFGEFYERELPRLVSVAMSMTGRRDEAADVAQEALLRAYVSWTKVSVMDRPEAWVRRVAVNLSIDAYRRQRRERTLRDRLEQTAIPFTAEPSIDAFWSTVRGLPARQRAAIVLRYAADLSVDEIAETLSVRSGTVTRSLSDARRTLSRLLALKTGVVDD